jgi:putative hydrolase of the HAD superfamily
MGRLSAILFDIDDTLCATTEFARRARRNAIEAMIHAGVDLPAERLLAELDEVIAEFTSNYEHHFDKLLLRLDPERRSRSSRALIVAAGVAAYHDTKFRELRPFPGVPELMSDLSRKGLRLGVITHGLAVKQAEKLVRLKLLECMDPGAIFISDEIGINKPNPKLYKFALNALGLPAREVMYVGDNIENDVVPPKSLGMITVWARLSGRHASREQAPGAAPDHVIESFEGLRSLLRDTYGLPV